jgi:hypothetical protein
MALLVGATHDVDKAISVQSVAMDLARFKNISLGEASEALTKVEAGSFRILKSLGIELKAGATQTQALAAVEKVAGAQARTYAESDLGKVAVASAKAEQAQEKFGKGLSHLEAVVLPAAAAAISGLGYAAQGLTDAFDSTVSKADKMRHAAEALQSGMEGDSQGAKDMAANLLKAADALDKTAALTAAAHHAGDDFGRALADDAAFVKAAAQVGIGDPIMRTAKSAADETLKTYEGLVTNLGSTLRSNSDAIDTAARALADHVRNPITTAARIAEREAYLLGPGMAAGLHSSDPIVRAEAVLLAQQIRDEIEGLQKAAGTYGLSTGTAWGAGLAAGAKAEYNSVYAQVSRYATLFKASSPPGPESPLHQIDVWGQRTAEAYVGGFARGMGGTGDVVSGLRGMATGPSGTVGSSAFGLAGGASGGTPVELPIVLDGREIGRVVDRRLYLALAGAGGSTRPR